MKDKLVLTVSFVFVMLCVFGIGTCLGNDDLDDKISKYTDDPIDKDDELGKATPNLNYIILDAMSKSKKGDSGNENSVVIYGDANNSTIINVVRQDQTKGGAGGTKKDNNATNSNNTQQSNKNQMAATEKNSLAVSGNTNNSLRSANANRPLAHDKDERHARIKRKNNGIMSEDKKRSTGNNSGHEGAGE